MYKLLLIDDDAEIRALLADYFTKLHPFAELYEAVDVKSGLEILASVEVDCILLDYMLPDMDGLLFIEFIAAQEPSSGIPVIMLTGEGNEKIAVEALKRGVSDYIVKNTLNITTLALSVTNAVDKARAYKKQKSVELALVESEARYRDLFENANDLIQSVSPEGYLLYANRAWCKALGYELSELKNRSIFELIHPESQGHCEAVFSRLMAGEKIEYIETCFVTKGGQKLIVEGSLNCRFQNGKPVATRGIFRDITVRLAAEQALINEKERLHVTLHSIGDAVISTDAEGKIEFMNPTAEKLSGWHVDEVHGKPLEEIFNIYNEETKTPVQNPVIQCLKKNKLVGLPDNTVLQNRHNTTYSIQNSAAPIHSQTGDILGAVMVFQDVTETRVMAKEIHYQTRHDMLTGLLNRREFEQQLQAALQNTIKFGVSHVLCFLDLDNFKIVNDTAGHLAGDALLKQVAQLLDSRLGSTDTLARLGGDEFGILMEACSLDKAQIIAEDIINTIRGLRFNWNQQSYEVGICIGIVPITDQDSSTTLLMSHADVACYAAKDRGRNHVATYSSDNNDDTVIRRHQDLIRAASLHSALKNDKFCLYAQPIKALNNDEHFYELLLRLKDDNGELILPGTFIPAAERFNLMGEIDRWVIDNALHMYTQIFGTNYETTITINLSANSLADDDLLGFILSQFASSGVPTKCVCFEITETSAISNISDATRLIAALKDHGCTIALDDFGSGMSSFNYLKQFQIDYLKIDGSFMQGIIDDPTDFAMVESINHIGHVMGIQTIAEWVENDAVLEKLKTIDIDMVQGHIIGRPVPIESLKHIQNA